MPGLKRTLSIRALLAWRTRTKNKLEAREEKYRREWRELGFTRAQAQKLAGGQMIEAWATFKRESAQRIDEFRGQHCHSAAVSWWDSECGNRAKLANHNDPKWVKIGQPLGWLASALARYDAEVNREAQ
jgi:hypothetical protein